MMNDYTEEELLNAIASATDPDEAERLFRVATRQAEQSKDRTNGWRAVELRAERRWGQLLPPKTRGREGFSVTRGNAKSGADRVRETRARAVADVSQEVFDAYMIETKDKTPSRAGLLRGTAAPRGRRSYTDAETEALRKEVRQRLRAGKKTDFRELMARYDMGQGFVQQQIAIVKELMTAESQRPANGQAKTWNGKSRTTRQKELGQARKLSDSENYLKLMKMQAVIWKLCAVLENFHIEDMPLDEYTIQTITALLDDLISLGIWHHQTLSAVSKWVGDADRKRKIEALRNTDGRQPEEVKAYLAMADKLERKLLG